ncbi:auxin-responsive protein IAA14-like isoform X1 [Rhododendron vialii]|uniref:auxin-responsive protein IAA14-like isoform X1 n=1 Tax=Rhododendron vialii TaxID=182163 RepID=UPI00265F3058|nr:auxin-responsive protein IAA14-like isoform X1 [Rhododendron vialii]
MELELGLGISGNGFRVGMKGFDLNCYGSGETKDALDVGSCLWSESNGDHGEYCNSEKKRGFCEAYDHEQGKFVLPRKTLPLLSWDNKQPNEEDDQTDDLDQNSSTSNNYEEEDGVVGWPPIKSWRKKLCQKNNVYGGGVGGDVVGGGGDRGGGGSNPTLVKVKMEGVVITRKVDLSLHRSYHELMDTLVEMFGRGEENGEAYNLTYQDREGDWLLAGDVPWSCFIESVQRLKLLRSME